MVCFTSGGHAKALTDHDKVLVELIVIYCGNREVTVKGLCHKKILSDSNVLMIIIIQLTFFHYFA